MQIISIDGKNINEEYGFITASVSIQQPDVQTKMVSIPMRDGSLDMTNAVSDAVRYKDRNITINLFRMEADESKLSALASFLHGQKRQIIFEDDPGYFYYGRLSIDNVVRTKGTMKVKITAVCEPFKYDVAVSDTDWEWDVFDLENGIINEAGNIQITPGSRFTLICRRQREFPVFIWNGPDLTLTFKGKQYVIKEGESKLYNVFFDEGENVLEFSGASGVLDIKYRGGSL